MQEKKRMEIEIHKQEVFREVEKRTSLEAAGLPDSFEAVWASEYEGGFLDSYWVEACTAVVQLFKRYIRSDTLIHSLATYDKNETLRMEAEMPSRYDERLTGSVATAVKMMMAAHIAASWLAVKAPDVAAKYEEESKEYAADLRAKLLYRRDPQVAIAGKDIEDDTDMEADTEGRGLIRKGTDHLRLIQYERCDHHFEPGRNHERRDERCPRHRP